MLPTVAIYVTPTVLYGVLCSAGTKGLRLEGVAVARCSSEFPFEQIRQQLGEHRWSHVHVVLDSSLAAMATFPLDRDTTEHIVSQQFELELTQQFLIAPTEPYKAQIHVVGPDIEGRTTAWAIISLQSQQEIVDHCSRAFEAPATLTAGMLATAATFAYNYPEHHQHTYGLVLAGSQNIEVAALCNRTLLHWDMRTASVDNFVSHLIDMIRSAVFQVPQLQGIFLAGKGLTRTHFARIAEELTNRFPEPVRPLSGFRMVECALAPQLCQAITPLGHVFAVAVGGVLVPLLYQPQWSVGTPAVGA